MLLLAVLATSCGEPKLGNQAEIAPSPAVAVRTVTLQDVEWESVLPVLGALEAHDRALLGAKVAGRVVRIEVDLGDRVEQGAVVAVIDPADYELELARVDAAIGQVRALLGLSPGAADDSISVDRNASVENAKALLDEAVSNHARSIELRRQGIASDAEFEATEVALRVARSRLDATRDQFQGLLAQLTQRRSEQAIARKALDDTRIIAPFRGVVTERLAGPGSLLAVGSPVAALLAIEPLRLRAEVPERLAKDVAVDQLVRVRPEGQDGVLEGRIARLSPEIRMPSRMRVIEADLANPGGLPAGLFARVEIVVDPRARAKALPASTLRVFSGICKVLVVEEGRIVEKVVEVGRRREGEIEILSGVEAGMRVVVEPGSLREGQPVSGAD